MRYFFITGFLRSGTTLVEKLVHALPGACAAPQPFPYLYYDTKRAFLRSRGAADERYPLGHLFGERRYQPEDFQQFLENHEITRALVAASFAAMRGYSGWQVPSLTPAGQEGRFIDVYRGLCDALPRVMNCAGDRLRGAKEVFCEEFMPYFLAEGVSVVLVLRDVRDVLTSLKFGAGASYGNRGLEPLHIVRQWRKSVAFALELEGRPGFECVRYEALVAQPRAWLDAFAARMACPPAPAGVIENLRDQEGREWAGNSSFAPLRGVSRDAVGRFAEHLPRELLGAVEWLCAPEMKVLGLTAEGEPHDGLADADERRRRELIESRTASEAEQRLWCVFPRAYRRLAL